MELRELINDKVVSVDVVSPKFDITCDVCVAGLGTAGAMSAIAAARQGADVFGFDQTQAAGGVAVSGAVHSYYCGSPGGIWEEIHARCEELAESNICLSTREHSFEKRSHTSAQKGFALEESLLSAGCRLSYESILTGVYMESNRVCGVRIFTRGQELNISAKVVIDGAEGIVARLAGCKFQPKRLSDGITMPYNVFQNALKDGTMVSIWKRGVFPDGKDMYTISEEILDAYSDVPYLHSADDAMAVDAGSLIGKRELPCIESEENLRFEDYFSGKGTKEPVFYAFSVLDNSAHDMAAEDKNLADWMFLAGIEGHGISIAVPKGALLPKNVDGIVVTGKVIGTGHEVMSCVRMKSDMEKCGEAAGVIAALAVKNNRQPKDVEYDEIKTKLEATGCLDPQWDWGFCDLRIKKPPMWQPIKLPETYDEIENILLSEHPEVALVTAVYRKVPTDIFRKLLSHEETIVREHAAVALGIRGEREAIPTLLEILDRKPAWLISYTKAPTFGWLLTTAHCNYLKALMLLGRFGCKEALPKIKRDLARLDEIIPTPEPHSPNEEETRKRFIRFLTYNEQLLSQN